MPVAKRVAYLRACRPEVAALNMGSMNYAKYSRSRKEFVFDMVFANPFDEIIELLQAMNELGSNPSTSASTSATSAAWSRWSTWACCARRCTSTA